MQREQWHLTEGLVFAHFAVFILSNMMQASQQALALIREISPEYAYLTHISHRMGRCELVQRQLPENVFLGYDGLSFAASTST